MATALIVAGCAENADRDASPKPKTSLVLRSKPAATTPEIDGEAGDQAWTKAEALVLKTMLPDEPETAGPDITLQSVTSGSRIYFLVSWADPEPETGAKYWRYDGTKWSREATGDRLCFFWNINHSIRDFDEDGCASVCHKEPGTKIIKSARRMRAERSSKSYDSRGDIWKWAPGVMQMYSVVSDGVFFATPLSPKGGKFADEAVIMFDNGEGGTKMWWTRNSRNPQIGSEDNPYPLWDLKEGLSPETTPFPYQSQMQDITDYSVYKAGDKIPDILLFDLTAEKNKGLFPNGKPEGSSVDISGVGKWENGRWTLEISRLKDTKHNDDVLFKQRIGKDAFYTFGLAVYIGEEPLHYSSGPAALVFEDSKP